MPSRAKRYTGRVKYVPPGERKRPSANARGYGPKWQRASKQYLNENPLCRACEDRGEVSPAEVVDHITPHRGNMSLFWNQKNWQPLCKQCHNSKTGKGQ